MQCYCGSKLDYVDCCKKVILDQSLATTPELLMRSRYSAYATGNGLYLVESTVAQHRVEADIELIEEHAQNVQWLKLEILSSKTSGDWGTVEFKAYYRENEEIRLHHEKSTFLRDKGIWYYEQGELFDTKIGRNEPCPCGSGKKYKRCCG